MTVRIEVESRLKVFADSKGLPVCYEGLPFTKPTTGGWLEIYFLGSNSKNKNLDGLSHCETGMFTVNVYGEIGRGVGLIESLAREVANLYPVIPKVGITSIEKAADIGRPLPDNGFMFVPVTLQYRAEF